MSPTTYRNDIIPQDTAEDESSPDTSTGQPLSEAEIEDLLYGEGRSTAERLQLLRALRADMAERADGDLADDDPGALAAEIDDRIAELEGDEDAGDAGSLDIDPLAHRETLSPDSDELEELEEEDEESLEGDEDDLPGDDDEEDDFDPDDEGDIDNDDDVAR